MEKYLIESEYRCDRAVVGVTRDPAGYANALLALASGHYYPGNISLYSEITNVPPRARSIFQGKKTPLYSRFIQTASAAAAILLTGFFLYSGVIKTIYVFPEPAAGEAQWSGDAGGGLSGADHPENMGGIRSGGGQ